MSKKNKDQPVAIGTMTYHALADRLAALDAEINDLYMQAGRQIEKARRSETRQRKAPLLH
jgi:hypothetical protein